MSLQQSQHLMYDMGIGIEPPKDDEEQCRVCLRNFKKGTGYDTEICSKYCDNRDGLPYGDYQF